MSRRPGHFATPDFLFFDICCRDAAVIRFRYFMMPFRFDFLMLIIALRRCHIYALLLMPCFIY